MEAMQEQAAGEKTKFRAHFQDGGCAIMDTTNDYRVLQVQDQGEYAVLELTDNADPQPDGIWTESDFVEPVKPRL